ncbi:DUF1934 domain-containing protein [Garciella nitratireducens]|uniref:Uncharacterized beta-barrel protein YwiB, DUF1934 family n=1 Tax=Garciella nitratireducens DSM 15102 TaxID=1121911 RepID=A0A1T4MGQ3_9FIRM|nr:DUF1934 domain-containing protein [Garciella nitratireducens]SJZ66093.1 Uncharacterized beta-barrel protein YwiB, DUF1934 family [Garciella nitratireducens DSM 15102]
MNKKVWLSIKGQQGFYNENPETIELLTEGELYNKNNSDYILYKESEVSGMKGTTTTIKIEEGGEQISIIRLGTTNSHMVFKKGEKKYDRYTTPYGDFVVSILTKNIDIKYDENKQPTLIHLDYHVNIQGVQGSKNTLEIQVKH